MKDKNKKSMAHSGAEVRLPSGSPLTTQQCRFMFTSVSQSPKAYPVRHALRQTWTDLAYIVLISPVPEQVDFF